MENLSNAEIVKWLYTNKIKLIYGSGDFPVSISFSKDSPTLTEEQIQNCYYITKDEYVNNLPIDF